MRSIDDYRFKFLFCSCGLCVTLDSGFTDNLSFCWISTCCHFFKITQGYHWVDLNVIEFSMKWWIGLKVKLSWALLWKWASLCLCTPDTEVTDITTQSQQTFRLRLQERLPWVQKLKNVNFKDALIKSKYCLGREKEFVWSIEENTEQVWPHWWHVTKGWFIGTRGTFSLGFRSFMMMRRTWG